MFPSSHDRWLTAIPDSNSRESDTSMVTCSALCIHMWTHTPVYKIKMIKVNVLKTKLEHGNLLASWGCRPGFGETLSWRSSVPVSVLLVVYSGLSPSVHCLQEKMAQVCWFCFSSSFSVVTVAFEGLVVGASASVANPKKGFPSGLREYPSEWTEISCLYL